MPLKSYDTKAAFDADYLTHRQAPDGSPTSNYERWWLAEANGDALERIVGALGLAAGANLFVVGCGFGWGVERLYDLGFNAWGVDVSAYIQAEKTNLSSRDSVANSLLPERVLPYDVTTTQGRQGVRRDTGVSTWDAILTDTLLNVLSDAEAASLSTWVHANYLDAGPLAHRVVTQENTGGAQPADQNTKVNLAAWRALIPADVFFDGMGRP